MRNGKWVFLGMAYTKTCMANLYVWIEILIYFALQKSLCWSKDKFREWGSHARNIYFLWIYIVSLIKIWQNLSRRELFTFKAEVWKRNAFCDRQMIIKGDPDKEHGRYHPHSKLGQGSKFTEGKKHYKQLITKFIYSRQKSLLCSQLCWSFCLGWCEECSRHSNK